MIAFSLCVLATGIVILGLSTINLTTTTPTNYGTQTYEILAGDETHPGFRGVSFSLKKGDTVHLSFSADKSVSYVIVTNATYWDWGSKYYAQPTPPDLMHEYPNYGSGWRVLSGEDDFVAPTDGGYTWIFLNTHNTYAHVTCTATGTSTHPWAYSTILSYIGISLSIMGAIVLAYSFGKSRTPK